MTLATVLDALEKIGHAPHPTGPDQWEARCPSHDDNTPSLSIKDTPNQVLVHCFAHCDTEHDVMPALGLPMSALFNKPLKEGAVRQEDTAWYEYADENGESLFRVIRSAPIKKFRQERPDGSGGWVGGPGATKGVRRVPYRLPELLKAVANDELIWVTEGEKDVDKLVAAGQVATCCPMGAGKWRNEFSEFFRGAKFVSVVADRDKGGYRHARDVARSLRNVVDADGFVDVYEPKQGKDVFDHLAFGHDLDDLVRLGDDELDQRCGDVPDVFGGANLPSKMSASVDAILHPEIVDTIGAAPDGLDLGDTSNSERLVMLYGEEMRLVREWNQWLVWDGKRWVPDPNNILVTKFAKGVKPYLQAMLPQVTGGQKEEMAFARGATRSGSRSAIDDMVKLARSNPRVLVEHTELDADPHLLNVGNGIVDLRTGELFAHDRAKLCTLQCAVKYDPDAISEEFEGFLDQIFDHDAELISYVQRLLGYCCTGIIADHILPVLHGVGANGKSTLIGIVQDVLGDYAVTAPEGLLVAQSRIPHEERIAVLRGRRLVVSNELEEKTTLAEQLVQKLTGGDTLTAREVYGKRFHFKPTQKVVLITNHAPRVTGTKHSIWRRIRLVPFNVVIEERAQKKDLRDRLVAENGPAILAWLVRGAHAWHRNGIGESTAVKDATEEYREAEDLFGSFMAECTMPVDRKHRSKVGDLYERWKMWCVDRGEKPGRLQDFAAALRDSDAETISEDGQNYVRGIGIRAGVGVVAES